MKPFENAKVGDLVYLPNDPKGYDIIKIETRWVDYIETKIVIVYSIGEFDINGHPLLIGGDENTYINDTYGQIIFPYPVTIQDGRCPYNCGNHECSMAKYCFGVTPLEYCECPDDWKPKEKS